MSERPSESLKLFSRGMSSHVVAELLSVVGGRSSSDSEKLARRWEKEREKCGVMGGAGASPSCSYFDGRLIYSPCLI